MNATVPPKLMPPSYSAAASGTLPIEQTKLMKAMNGPTTTFSRSVSTPCPERKIVENTDAGTATAIRPATT